MTTTEATTNELKSICEQVDSLVLVSDKLKRIYQVNANRLDQENAKIEPAATNSALGVQSQMLPELELKLRKFIVPLSRETAFHNLFLRIEEIMAQTAGARMHYDRNTQKFNRLSYDLLVDEEDKVGSSADIRELKIEIVDLMVLINRLKDLLK